MDDAPHEESPLDSEPEGHEHEEPRCEVCWNWDPLATERDRAAPGLDVILCGRIFFDLVFTGLDRLPHGGEELWASGMGSCPGGIANLAVAASRLGLKTGLVAGFGDDVYGAWMRRTLSEQEGIDLSASRTYPEHHTSVTVSMAVQDDRAMLTHGHPVPASLADAVRAAPPARVAIVDLGAEVDWWHQLAEQGTEIIADIGYDDTGRWDPARLEPLRHCRVFTPNAVEAMAYTRTDSPVWAARALAERVPLVVVTDGPRGALAVDSETGEEAQVPGVPVEAIDATGAGDVFCAGIAVGLFKQWPLAERLRFAALCSALSVQQFGGSLAAPGWGDLSDWWQATRLRAAAGEPAARRLIDEYGFLADCLPTHRVLGVRRAEATFALSSDADVSGTVHD